MTQEPVNLFSDTQTRPSTAMRRAMAEAEVGDEQRFLDRTTLELEARVAKLLDHEAGLFLPSGTMCNVIAFRLHVRPGGDEAILAANSHPVNFEAGSPATLAQAMTRQLDTPTGIFSPDQLEAAVRAPGDRYAPRSRLVSVENTTNHGGGRVWPLETIEGVLEVAERHGLRTHLDGARLMNAAVAARVPAADYARGFDTAWIDFSKGLGAPAGAVLVGSRELIDEAWRHKQMLGGALRQSGMLAAACLFALDHHVDGLAEDHEHARLLAQSLHKLPGVEIDPASVDTNIVIFGVADAPTVAGRLSAAGVQVTPLGPRRLRAVTHRDVDRREIYRSLSAFREVLGMQPVP
ncbi:MAG TPA: GntG family PLP-dependent aldolase [Thermoleophilaceae bacterium]|nr:GntG family PLP-dependent aldolase [Thermoleophilaceae bacterium]